MLSIFDKLMILSLHDEECIVLPSVAKRLDLALGGAVLGELILRGKVRVGSSSKLEVVDSGEIGDGFLDKALNRLNRSRQRRKVPYCIDLLNNELGKQRKTRVKRLIAEGVLDQAENGLTWVVPFANSPNPNASAKYVIKSQLRELVLTHGEPELPDLALLDLAKSSKLLNLIFTKDERKTAQRWIYAAMMTQALNEPIAQSLQEIGTALDSLKANS
jgi:Golgi phosphoprotein 3 (GPP34)